MTWDLIKQGTLLATLTLDYKDQPWFNCKFHPTPAFLEYEQVFNKLSSLVSGEDWLTYEEYYELEFMPMSIHLQERESGAIIKDYQIHISKGKARFKY